MADFKKFFPILLLNEGGFVNNPADPGGATNKGITLVVFQTYAKKLLNIDPTLDNLKKLTNDQAYILYKHLYWDTMLGDQFVSQELANIVCDFCVNSGNEGVKLLQQVLNKLGSKLIVDGQLGAATLGEIAKYNVVDIYQNYKQGRKDFYIHLCEHNPKFLIFKTGWLNRVNNFPDLKK